MNTIDLTIHISEKLPSFPGSPKPHFVPWSTIKKDGYNLELLFMSSHSGTHIDAPFHFVSSGPKIHQISTNRLVNEAILIHVSKKENQAITKSDILAFEKDHKQIPMHATIVFRTDWSKNLQSPAYFEKNPGLAVSAAKYLASKKVNLVAIDSPSIDLGSDEKFPVHSILSKKSILIVENLTNLEKIKNIHFVFVVLPLKLENATGSPVRAIALQTN